MIINLNKIHEIRKKGDFCVESMEENINYQSGLLFLFEKVDNVIKINIIKHSKLNLKKGRHHI